MIFPTASVPGRRSLDDPIESPVTLLDLFKKQAFHILGFVPPPAPGDDDPGDHRQGDHALFGDALLLLGFGA